MTDNFIMIGYQDCNICRHLVIPPGCDTKICDICQNAKLAYDVYSEAVESQSFNGEKLKEFQQLPYKIKLAWRQVYKSVVNNYRSRNMLPLE